MIDSLAAAADINLATHFSWVQQQTAGMRVRRSESLVLTDSGLPCDTFNAVCREQAARAGAHWIDIAPVSRERGAEPAMLADDGLHPSAAMYALWAALALPAAREALRR